MKSLLKKDIYLLWRAMPVSPILLAALSILSMANQSNLGLLVVFGNFVAGTVEFSMEMDEGTRWHVLLDTMPLSRKAVVCEKYTLLCLVALSAAVLQAVLNTIYGLIRDGRVEAGNVLFLPMIVFAAAMLSGCVLLPFVFRYGCALGRIFLRLVFAVGLGIAIFLAKDFKLPNHIPLHPLALFSIPLGAGLLFAAVSYLISSHWYRQRDLR